MDNTLRLNNEDKKLIFYVSLIGIITHGFMIFNKFSLNDDNDSIFNLGTTYPQGRWLLGIFDDFMNKMGTFNFSLPTFNGVLTIFFIALASCYICKILDVKDFKLKLLLGGSLVTVIEVAALMGFMFTSWANSLALLLSVMSAVLCILANENNQKKIIKIIGGAFLLACSLGLYQAYMSIFICIILLFLLLKYSSVKITIIEFIKEAVKYCCCLVLGLLIYFIINKIALNVKHTSMTNYQNMNNWGIVSATEYLERIKTSYIAFFNPQKYNVTIFPELLSKIYPALLVLIFIGIALLFYIVIKKKLGTANIVTLLFIILLLPLSINFHYLLSDLNLIHSNMIYSSVFIYVLIISLFQKIYDSEIILPIKKVSINVVTCIIFITCILNARIVNFLYLKAFTIYENNMTYFTTLVSRITSIDGYDNTMPLIFYNIENVDVSNFYYEWRMDTISYLPFYDQVANQDQLYFFSNWSGFRHPPATSIDEKYQTELDEMNIYPNDGSIRIIDNTIVVKFSD